MIKISIYIFQFMVCCGVSFAYELPVSTSSHKVEFSADKSYYSDENKTINLKGNVQLDELAGGDVLIRTIKAEELSVNLSSRTMFSPRKLEITQNKNIIKGESGGVNYSKSEGYVYNGRLDVNNMIFRGKHIKFGSNKFIYKKASITTCDRDSPHYRIKASRIDLIPDKRFMAYNTFFYLGKIPIFYFPFLYKPLGKGTPFVSSFFPGYDKRNGMYLKSNYMYRFSEHTKGKLFLDYFSRKGFGAGGEFDYYNRAKNISNISIYRIKEYGSSSDRLGVNGGYWHLLGNSSRASYYSQSFFRWLSDSDFNNDFFRSNPFAVSPDKQANLAFTRQTGQTVTRVSAASRYDRDLTSGGFNKSYESAPRIDFNTVPIKFKRFPFLHSFSANFESAKESGLSYYQKKGVAGWTISNNFRISESFTFYPAVYYNESVFLSTASATNSWIGRYGTNLNLRYDKIFGSFDLSYFYKRRLQPNKMRNDSFSPDEGKELKAIGYNVFIRPNYNMYFRSNAQYDLRDYFSKSALKRLSPINAEIYVSGKLFSFYVQDTYSPSMGNQALISQINAGDDKNYIGFGFANYKTSKDSFILHNTFGFKPGKSGWRIEGVIRYKIVKKMGAFFENMSFFERSFILYKDFHDFRTKWKFTRRPNVNEFFFLVNLKINAKKAKERGASDQYWRPWREDDEMRD